MGTSSATEDKKGHSSDGSRLKREDHCLPTAQDTLFSSWKILVGPNDWKNHSNGVEGAERYRLHNLPASYFGPGVYELALHLDKCTNGNDSKKDALRFPKKDSIVVVYVGQAENVRTRLQHYGRCGSHLEGGIVSLQGVKPQHCETMLSTVLQTGPGDLEKISDSLITSEAFCHPRLFTKAFLQGYSIAFRWTAAESKGDAAAIETGLLALFDYAWNKGSNGKRRPCDAFKKLRLQTQSSSKAGSWYKPSKWTLGSPRIGTSKVRNVREKGAVVTIFTDRLRKLNYLAKRVSAPDGRSDLYLNLLSLPWKLQVNEEKSLSSSCVRPYKSESVLRLRNTNACGILDADGVACENIPMKGRKRCETHKGMRVRCASRAVNIPMGKKHLVSVHACEEDVTKARAACEPSRLLVCGYLLKDGSKCTVLPEKGRKRCLSHKGRRIKML